MRTIIVGPRVNELSITNLGFSVHLLHTRDVLVVLLAATFLFCGREEHREQVPKVEKVDTDDNSSALGPIFMNFDVLESTEHDTITHDNNTKNIDLPERPGSKLPQAN